MSKGEKLILAAIAAYSLMMVLCFGPATVDSERARQEHITECMNTPANITKLLQRAYCERGAPMISDAAAKAIFWPFWLSYKAAQSWMGPATQTGGGNAE